MNRRLTSPLRVAQETSRRTLVLVDDLVRDALPGRLDALQSAGAWVETVDYRRLSQDVERLRQIVREQKIDFVLFARNDQVFGKVSIGPVIRALRIGYSSFSGIDSPDYIQQTRVCLDDYLSGDARLAPAVGEVATEKGPPKVAGHVGTFSLVFDLEQLGGARFGLPRILDVLDRHGVTATFFTTNFIHEVYSDVAALITRRHHEIGLHGLHHEYLAGRPPSEQLAMVDQMKRGFGPGVSIEGANFIGRMDANTVEAMAGNGLRYWVQFMEHRYIPFAYRKMPMRPLPVWTPKGMISLVPISVETNNRPWFSVRNMLDSAVRAANDDRWPHVNLLLHPFRDGSREHLGELEQILVHMRHRGYAGVPVSRTVADLPEREPDSYIYYPVDGVADQARHAGHPAGTSWWLDATRYLRRVWRLFSELEVKGARPALCPALPNKGGRYAVYPHLPAGSVTMNRVKQDPLRWQDGLNMGELGTSAVNAFIPGGGSDLAISARAMLPRVGRDLVDLLPEVALRVAYRLAPGRHLF